MHFIIGVAILLGIAWLGVVDPTFRRVLVWAGIIVGIAVALMFAKTG